MKFTTVFFDLDGTVTDSGEGIFNSVIFSLEKMGKPVPEMSVLRKFIGPPLEYSYTRYCGFSRDEAMMAIDNYRIYYEDKGIEECYLYKGIAELIKTLHANSVKVVLATSKPEAFARRIIERFELDNYFFEIAGANMDEGIQTSKSDVIADALIRAKITDKSRVVMVGDRKHDIIGAKDNGLISIGVLYGFGERKELEKEGATYIVPTVKALADFLLK